MEEQDRIIQQLKVINQQLTNRIYSLEKDNKSLKLSIFFYAMDIEFLKAALKKYMGIPEQKTNYSDLELNDEDKKFMKDMGIQDKDA